MSVDRPIIKKDAFMYLLGFHCAGAQLSEQEQAAVGFNTTVEASSNPETAGTANPDSAFSTQGTVTTTISGAGAIPLVIMPNDYFTVPEKTHETPDPETGEPIPVDITRSYTDQTIGNAAVYYGADCEQHSSYYSQDYRKDKDHPPGTYGYYYDCSSLVSRIYNKILTDAGYTDYANEFANWRGSSDGWSCKNTEGLAALGHKYSLFICINCYDESLLLPGDIILTHRTNNDGDEVSDKDYNLNHALLFVGDGRALHITNPGEPMYYITFSAVYKPERVRFVLRPSLKVLNCKGLSIDTSKRTTEDVWDSYQKKYVKKWRIPMEYKQSVYIPQGSDT